MAYRLVGQDCSVTLNIGGTWDGTPAWEGANSIKRVNAFAAIGDMIYLAGLVDAVVRHMEANPSCGCSVCLYVLSKEVDDEHV